MYRFQIRANTSFGESIGLIGSTPELGSWSAKKALRLKTDGERYPLWWTSVAIPVKDRVEYKYIRFLADGGVAWERDGGPNRWVPAEDGVELTVDDGAFGYVQPWPFAFIDDETKKYPSIPDPLEPLKPGALKIVLIGSSVACGYNAWLRHGWGYLLGQALYKHYGHQFINVSESGANVTTTMRRFPEFVTPHKPDVVIIGLSLGNEGLAHCPPNQRRAAQRTFECGIKDLVKMVKEIGAKPVLGGVYPNGDYCPDTYAIVKQTRASMDTLGVPILDWLDAVDDGSGRWKEGVSFDPAHPNSLGHKLMFEAIDLTIFEPARLCAAAEPVDDTRPPRGPVFADPAGFVVDVDPAERCLTFENSSAVAYDVNPSWGMLNNAVSTRQLAAGLYVARDPPDGVVPFVAIGGSGRIENSFQVPAGCSIKFEALQDLFSPAATEVLYYDGHLGVLRSGSVTGANAIHFVNESDTEYNVHPMWYDVRKALRAMPPGVYADTVAPDAPFRTVVVSKTGLQSRIKLAPRCCRVFRYVSPLEALCRKAIIPLGDRCAVRMLLYKMEFDGPCYPFDLTRSTSLGDVADIIASDFTDMWNPELLTYDAEAGRIWHRRWSGLSFAHEVEEGEDPVNDMTPVLARMRSRYSARAARFRYTTQQCDEAVFIRTGCATRGEVCDLLDKLHWKLDGKPFRFILISQQASDEFGGLENVYHYRHDFNPDRMNEDPGYWTHCTGLLRHLLSEFHGITSRTLFWCPPSMKELERDEAADGKHRITTFREGALPHVGKMSYVDILFMEAISRGFPRNQ